MLPSSDQALLLEYAAARSNGDEPVAARAWKRLVVNNFDRVQQIVKAFRFSPAGPKLPEDEWGSAAIEAYLRVIAMGARFEQREAGAFRPATPSRRWRLTRAWTSRPSRPTAGPRRTAG